MKRGLFSIMIIMLAVICMACLGCADDGGGSGESQAVQTYTITFMSNGVAYATSSIKSDETAFDMPADPVSTDNSFAGWYVDEKYSKQFTANYFATTTPSADITVYAKWQEITAGENECKVTFDSDGGSTISAVIVAIGSAVSVPSTPTKEGHTFAGWYCGNDEWDFATTLSDDVTLTAKWDVNQYTITWANYDGSTLDTDSVAYGTLPSYDGTPTKPAQTHYTYEFIGWDTAIVSVSGAKTYTAEFQQIANSYTITFTDDSGSTEVAYTYGESIDEPALTERANYSVQWDGYELDGDYTVEAVYTIDTHTVTFDSNGGSAVASISTDYGSSIAQPDSPTLDGYIFDGWYIGEALYNFDDIVTGDTTLTAKWAEQPSSTEGLVFALNADDSSYNVSSVGTATDADIIIESTYNNLPVVGISSKAFYGCKNIVSVQLPDSLTEISSNAFSGCYKLIEIYNKSEIDISAGGYSSSYVGYYARNVYTDESGGSKLTMDSDGYRLYSDGDDKLLVDYLGDSESVTVPDDVTAVYPYALYTNENIVSVDMSDSVASIGTYAFAGCNSLISAVVGDGVTIVDPNAFEECYSLVSVVIGSSVKDIEESVFSDCYKLVEVYNKSGLTIKTDSYGNGYAGYYALNVYTDEAGGSKLSTDSDGFIVFADGSDKLLVGYAGEAEDISVPSSVTQIYKYAFYYNDNVASVTLSSGVTAIGDYAFAYCDVLASVEMPSGLLSIGSYAFYDSGLVGASIPDSVLSMGDYAFSYCENLSTATIGDGVASIGERVFLYCTDLVSVVVGDSVASIGYEAFNYCTSLASINLPDSIKSIASWAFNKCESLPSVVLPADITTINAYTFGSCTSLAEVTIPSSVTSIGNAAFKSCGFTSIVIPSSVTSIEYYAFVSCDKLVELIFADTSTWYSTQSSTNFTNKSGGTQTDVSNPASNASMLKNTYDDYYWYKL